MSPITAKHNEDRVKPHSGCQWKGTTSGAQTQLSQTHHNFLLIPVAEGGGNNLWVKPILWKNVDNIWVIPVRGGGGG